MFFPRPWARGLGTGYRAPQAKLLSLYRAPQAKILSLNRAPQAKFLSIYKPRARLARFYSASPQLIKGGEKSASTRTSERESASEFECESAEGRRWMSNAERASPQLIKGKRKKRERENERAQGRERVRARERD